jgi:hypothetical protein
VAIGYTYEYTYSEGPECSIGIAGVSQQRFGVTGVSASACVHRKSDVHLDVQYDERSKSGTAPAQRMIPRLNRLKVLESFFFNVNGYSFFPESVPARLSAAPARRRFRTPSSTISRRRGTPHRSGRMAIH